MFQTDSSFLCVEKNATDAIGPAQVVFSRSLECGPSDLWTKNSHRIIFSFYLLLIIQPV